MARKVATGNDKSDVDEPNRKALGLARVQGPARSSWTLSLSPSAWVVFWLGLASQAVGGERERACVCASQSTLWIFILFLFLNTVGRRVGVLASAGIRRFFFGQLGGGKAGVGARCYGSRLAPKGARQSVHGRGGGTPVSKGSHGHVVVCLHGLEDIERFSV